MLIQQLLETLERKLPAVIYGGRFQPFHRGHYAVYKHLCKAFGSDAVWIASSNKVNFDPAKGDVSPLTFEERKEVMVRLYDIDSDHIVQCKNPTFSPVEILKLYKGPTVCIMVVGSKDIDRYRSSKYFERYPTNKHGKPQPFNSVVDKLNAVNDPENGTMYYVVADSHIGHLSGTKVRDMLTKAAEAENDDKVKDLFKEFFGKYDETIAELLFSKLSQVKIDAPEPPKEEDDEEAVKKLAKSKPKDDSKKPKTKLKDVKPPKAKTPPKEEKPKDEGAPKSLDDLSAEVKDKK